MDIEALRRRVWHMVEADADGDLKSRLFDIFIIGLILLNVTAVIVESMAEVQARFSTELYAFELFSVAVFTMEYALRMWSVTANPAYAHPLKGRFRFAIRPLPLIDLLAILPYYLALIGVDLRVLRALRVMRLLRIAKLARYHAAFRIISQVIRQQKEALILTVSVLVVLLVVSSALMYYAEHFAQPESFPDIPTTMWWSIVTLTTVGYGDIYPITAAGRILAAIISIFGIGMVALPAGIIGSGFVEQIQRKQETESVICPHCGKCLNDDHEQNRTRPSPK